jgi:nitroreductase
MQPIAPQNLIANLSWRYAVKKFDATRKIPADTWSTLEQSILLAPSSYGLQPSKFVVVTDPQVRAKLREASWNQPQITDASHLVVFCQKLSVTTQDVEAFVDHIVRVRGTPREQLKGLRDMVAGHVAKPETLPGGDMITYTRSQTYIALGFFLSACAMLGVDACPMEGFDPKGYDAILGLSKEGYMPVVLGAAGYRSSEDWLAKLPKVRRDAAQIIRRV